MAMGVTVLAPQVFALIRTNTTGKCEVKAEASLPSTGFPKGCMLSHDYWLLISRGADVTMWDARGDNARSHAAVRYRMAAVVAAIDAAAAAAGVAAGGGAGGAGGGAT